MQVAAICAHAVKLNQSANKGGYSMHEHIASYLKVSLQNRLGICYRTLIELHILLKIQGFDISTSMKCWAR